MASTPMTMILPILPGTSSTADRQQTAPKSKPFAVIDLQQARERRSSSWRLRPPSPPIPQVFIPIITTTTASLLLLDENNDVTTTRNDDNDKEEAEQVIVREGEDEESIY
jgi:hypothetical protein